VGIIEKQATKNTIFSYAGAALGFLSVVYSTRVLSTDENGLIGLLLSLSILLAQIGALGFNNVSLRYFPYFRNKEKGHHGFLFYGIVVTSIGFLLCLMFYFSFQDYLIQSNQEKSKLFVNFMDYILPLTFFTLFFNLFDYYLRSSFSSVIGTSSKDVTQRILILLLLTAYYFNWITFNTFVLLYVAAVAIPTFILLFYIVKLGEWHVKPIRGVVDRKMRKEMIVLGLYSLLAGGGGLFLANIDLIMVNQLLGLSETGIYSIAFYFGTMIIIPSRSIIRIAIAIIAESFKKDDYQSISSIYRKSCNTQLTIGLLLFIGLWCSIDNVMQLLPPAYRGGEYVIFYIALGYLIDMATGVNYVIIITSKYFRYDGYFMVFVLILAVLTNYFLIPLYGIKGAAMATAITIATYNGLRWWFVYYQFKMQPFNTNTIKLLLIGVVVFCVGYYFPHHDIFFIDIAIRSLVIGVSFVLLLLRTEASPEINAKIRKNLKLLPFYPFKD
jgi:O-antigen/teichoic acid export membrane protein